MTADGRLLFHQHYFETGVGQIERRLDAGDAAADDQHASGHWHADRLQGYVPLCPTDRRARDADRLLGGLVAIAVHPGALLTDIGDFALEAIQAALLRRIAECLLVQSWRAAGDDDAVQLVVLDGIDDRVLSRVRAHVHIVAGDDDAIVLAQFSGNFLHVHRRGNIVAAVADENAGAFRAHFIAIRSERSRPAEVIAESR